VTGCILYAVTESWWSFRSQRLTSVVRSSCQRLAELKDFSVVHALGAWVLLYSDDELLCGLVSLVFVIVTVCLIMTWTRRFVPSYSFAEQLFAQTTEHYNLSLSWEMYHC